MNEDAIADQMFMMQMNERMGIKDGGKVPGIPAGRQEDARERMFIPMGGAKRADDVPAMLSVNEFVLNDDAVAGLGKLMTGNPDPRAGARALYRIQDQLELRYLHVPSLKLANQLLRYQMKILKYGFNMLL